MQIEDWSKDYNEIFNFQYLIIFIKYIISKINMYCLKLNI